MADSGAQSSIRQPPGPVPPTILIVEDDDATRAAVQTLLELDGYRVATATNGQEGLECLRDGLVPDVILLDLSMPRMDGFQFRREQRREPRFAPIPVVIYSSLDDTEPRMHALDAAAFLVKPVDPDHLRSVLAKLCNADDPQAV